MPEERSSVMRNRRKWIILTILIAVALALIHYAIRLYIPAFTVRYDGPPRPGWIPFAIDGEFLLHLFYLGALISVSGRSIPSHLSIRKTVQSRSSPQAPHLNTQTGLR